MDRSQTMPNMRKPYENAYTKTFEGSTWRGQDANLNAERYGPKPTTPRFQANNQYNGHVQPNEAVQNGTDVTGKPVRQPRPNTYQNRQNGTYVPRNYNHTNTNDNTTVEIGGPPHQGGPPYQGVNPNPNGYQGNRAKPEASAQMHDFIFFTPNFISFFNCIFRLDSCRATIQIEIRTIAIRVDRVDKITCKMAIITIAIHTRSNQMQTV